MRLYVWCALWLVFICAPAFAITQVPTIDGLSNSLRYPPTSSFDSVVVASNYHATGDEGGGTFVLWGTGHCTSFYASGDDSGVVFESSITVSGTTTYACYYRQFTGAVHLKWYNVAKNADVVSACPMSSSHNCLANAFIAAQQIGDTGPFTGNVGTVDIDGLRISSSANVVIPAYERLTCEAPLVGLMAKSDYSSIGGAILLDHGTTIYIHTDPNALPVAASGDQVEFDHCLVLTDGTGGAPIKLDPFDAMYQQRQAITNYQNMVANGDTGIFCDGAEQPYIHDVTFIGFDTGVTSFNCGRFRLEHANIDADVPVYIADGKSVAHLSHISAQPFLSRNVPNKNKQYPISGVQADSGECQVSFSDTGIGSTELLVGDYVYLNGDGNYHPSEGVLGCEGLHTIAARSDSGGVLFITLSGTSCPSPDCYGSPVTPFLTTGATWASHSQVIQVDDTTGIHANEIVSSSDGGVFTGTTKVISVSPYSNKVVVDHFTTDASTGSQTMTFTNPGSCPTGCGLTLYDFAAVHIAAGNSLGGLATNHRAACIRAGGPGDTSALGVIADDIFCGQYQIEYDLESADPFTCTGCGFDNEPSIADSSQIAVLYGRATPPLGLMGTTSGQTISNLTVNGLPITPSHAGYYKSYVVSGADIPAGDTIDSTDDVAGTITLHTPVNVDHSSPIALTATPPTGAQEDTGAADFVGTDFGSGGGVIVDAANGFCNAMQGGIVKPNGTDILAVEYVSGCGNINISTGRNNDVLVGAGTRAGSSMIGSSLAASAMVLEPNSTTPVNFAALGNYFGQSGAANTANFGANASCPASSDTTVLVLCGGGAQNNPDSGNAYSQCNPNYATGCVQHGMTAAGAARQLDSSGNPVAEFKDATHMQLTHTYQDQLQANVKASAAVVAAGVNAVDSINGSCSSTCGVKLPLTSSMLDAASTPPGSACYAAGTGKCGAAGGITIINNTAGTLYIWPSGADRVNGSTLIPDSINASHSKTYWPGAGTPTPGWFSP